MDFQSYKYMKMYAEKLAENTPSFSYKEAKLLFKNDIGLFTQMVNYHINTNIKFFIKLPERKKTEVIMETKVYQDTLKYNILLETKKKYEEAVKQSFERIKSYQQIIKGEPEKAKEQEKEVLASIDEVNNKMFEMVKAWQAAHNKTDAEMKNILEYIKDVQS